MKTFTITGVAVVDALGHVKDDQPTTLAEKDSIAIKMAIEDGEHVIHEFTPDYWYFDIIEQQYNVPREELETMYAFIYYKGFQEGKGWK